jgi:outer membrane lipoprotein-sorting protein
MPEVTMLKLIPQAVLSIGGMLLISSVSLAQITNPQNHATPNWSELTEKSSQDDTPIDTAFTTALSKHFEDTSYASKSTVTFQYNLPQGATNFQFNVNSVVQADGKFRAIVTLPTETIGKERTVLITSDGNSVWIYRDDLQEYSVHTYQQFMQSSDWMYLGYSAAAFLKAPLDMRLGIAKGYLQHPDATKAFIAGIRSHATFESSIQTVNSKSFYTYDATLPNADQTKITIWIDPQQQTFSAMRFSGLYQGHNLDVTEVMNDRSPMPKTLPATSFQFQAPANSRRNIAMKVF